MNEPTSARPAAVADAGEATAFQRVFDSKPEWIGASHTGVMLVNVLFGLVTTQIAIALAADLADTWQGVGSGPWSWTRFGHLLVAAVVTVTSFIGYHTSQHRASFRLKFVNLPMVQFTLDVTMVFVYFLILRTAERIVPARVPGGDPTVVGPDARWEVLLVAVAFLLYAGWDWTSYRIQCIDKYRAERVAHEGKALRAKPRWFTPRRAVTAVSLLVAAAAAVVVWVVRPESGSSVAAIDVALIAGLLLYRMTKAAVPDEWSDA